MKRLYFLIVVFACFVANAANVSFNDFDPNQVHANAFGPQPRVTIWSLAGTNLDLVFGVNLLAVTNGHQIAISATGGQGQATNSIDIGALTNILIFTNGIERLIAGITDTNVINILLYDPHMDGLFVTNGITNGILQALGGVVWADGNGMLTNIPPQTGSTFYAAPVLGGQPLFRAIAGADIAGAGAALQNIGNAFKQPNYFNAITVTNGLTNFSLTASTVLQADANKAESSIPNAAGALTNNGSGVVGYYNAFAALDANNHFTGLPLFSGSITSTASNTWAGNQWIAGNETVTGGITNNSLTASSVLQADANKRIVSVPNAVGVLTNNNAGGIGWIPMSSAGSFSQQGTNMLMTTNGSLITFNALTDTNVVNALAAVKTNGLAIALTNQYLGLHANADTSTGTTNFYGNFISVATNFTQYGWITNGFFESIQATNEHIVYLTADNANISGIGGPFVAQNGGTGTNNIFAAVTLVGPIYIVNSNGVISLTLLSNAVPISGFDPTNGGWWSVEQPWLTNTTLLPAITSLLASNNIWTGSNTFTGGLYINTLDIGTANITNIHGLITTGNVTNEAGSAVAYMSDFAVLTNTSLYFPTNPFPMVAGTSLQLSGNTQFAITNNTVNVTGFTAVSNNLVSWARLGVSNSAAGAITIQWPASVKMIGGTNTGSSVSLPSSKVWYGTFTVDPIGTNLTAAAQVN